MSRNSQQLDKKMLQVGKRMLIQHGASGLSIRELTKEAQVNLGMFSYHFKNKDTFISQLLDDIYLDLSKELDLTTIKELDPLAQLEEYLTTINNFAQKHRTLIISLLKDILDEQLVVQQFLRRVLKRHFILLAKTVRQAQKEKLIIDAPLLLILTQLISGVGLANLIPVILGHAGINKLLNIGLQLATRELDSEKNGQLRINLLIKSITL